MYTKNGLKSTEVVYTGSLKDMHSAIRRKDNDAGGRPWMQLQDPNAKMYRKRIFPRRIQSVHLPDTFGPPLESEGFGAEVRSED